MNEKIERGLFLVRFLITRPFKILIGKLEKLDNLNKPRVLLKFLIAITVVSLFPEAFSKFLFALRPNFTFLSLVLLLMAVVVYIWKYTDPNMGQSWKQHYKIWKENKK